MTQTKRLIYCVTDSQILEDSETRKHQAEGHSILQWSHWDGRRQIEIGLPVEGKTVIELPTS